MRMCRRLGIEGECSTEVGWKSAKELRGMMGEGRGGVGMRYEVKGAGRLVRTGQAGLLRRMSWEVRYGEWLVREIVSSVCEDRWAAIGPQTSGNSGTLPVTNG
jgi:hypothetical protein